MTTNRPELTGSRWRAIRRLVLERDSHICWLCGRKATQVDHLTPASKGGTDEMRNLAAICFPCNNRKNDRWDDRPEHTIIW
jgi:5-methylcytosine-specific restriction endonuclease McrA